MQISKSLMQILKKLEWGLNLEFTCFQAVVLRVILNSIQLRAYNFEEFIFDAER